MPDGRPDPVSDGGVGGERGRIGTDRFSRVDEALIHQGAIIGFYATTIETAAGARFARDLIRHPGAVAVVPIDGDDILLVQQYRAALDADLIEIPAGKRDVSDEPPIVTARRELVEEVGMEAATMEPLINLHHSPGFCDEYGHVFLATGLSPVAHRREGPEEQAMTIHRLPLADAVEMCLDGRITDAKSIGGILAAARRLGV